MISPRRFPAPIAGAVLLIIILMAVVGGCGKGSTSETSPQPAGAPSGAARTRSPGEDRSQAAGLPESASQTPPTAPGGAGSTPAGSTGMPGEQKPIPIPPPISVDPKMVVARVNGEQIAGSDLNRAFSTSFTQFVQNGVILAEDEQHKLMQQILEAMIGSELLRQKALADGFKPDDKAVEDQYRRLQAGASSEEQFHQMLEQKGLTPEKVRTEITRNQIVNAFIQKFATNHAKEIASSEGEAKAFYDAHQDTFMRKEMVRARHILRKVPQNATDKQKQAEKEKIEEAMAKLKAGEDFAQLARTYSADGSAVKGGDLGFFPRGVMVPQFEEVAFSLKPGETSGIVESRFGYHIIRCEGKTPAGVVPFTEVKGPILQKLTEDKKQKALSSEIDKLRARGKVEVLLKATAAAEAAEPAAPPAG